jgi:hypothetical protein
MQTDKLIYWTTLGVLAMATISGFVTGHRGWGDRVADRSVAMMAEASGVAKNYAEIAGMMLGSAQSGSEVPSPAVIDIQDEIQNEVHPHLACAERILVKRQAQLARLQAVEVRFRAVERVPRMIAWPNPRIVVEVPQISEGPQ